MGYARYGSSGKGLSDRAQRTYNAIKRSKVSGVARVYADREAMLFGSDQAFRGLYQILGASGLHVYTPAFRTAYAAAGTAERKTLLAGLTGKGIGAQPGSQFGVHTTGYGGTGRGMPQWVQRMLTKGSALGRPPGKEGDEGVGTLIGLATGGYLLFKVLV